ncbi:sensor histidine kinase TodS [Clostridium acetireducens DSM 10703]|uniref:histidine kinase n=1 Tax=Clostridium acetireducens DSM 10703 TaxID=1121290 RepID=A0A1E8EZG3_9CLOT|nr:HAMP domain-containing sensor histidine kinase [Clostridium acetireducens]OFI06534.1 sensor histidine kinase TodS [Clostridium acetireducens DSM 10703]
MKNKVYKVKNKYKNEIKYIEINIRPIFNEQSKLKYTIVNVKDVTDKKIHEILLNRKSQFIKDVVNTIDVPIAVINYPSLKYKLINKKYKEVLKVIKGENFKEDVVGKNITDIFSYLENKDAIEKLKYVGETGKNYMLLKQKILGIDNKKIFYKIGLIPRKVNGKTIEIHVHAVDISNEINTNLMLKKISKDKDDFFNVISHELRTPLTIVYSSLQLAYYVYKKDINPNIDKILITIKQNCSRLLKLINNVFVILQGKEGAIKINSSNFDIVELTENIVTLANNYAKRKNISIIFDTNKEEKLVCIDKEKYQRIILNLLSNAIKFTSENKKIFVCLNIKNDYFELSVKDQGVGMPKNKISAIFDRFCQINTTLSREAEGTGLGLNVVKLLLSSMEGKIIVKTEENKGSEFIIKLNNYYKKSNNTQEISIMESDIDKIVDIEFSDINC